MRKPLQVHLYMHFSVSVCIQFWDTETSIGKAVPCNFLCLNFLLELFLYTLCDYMGKKTSSKHFSNCVAKHRHLIPYVSTCYIFLSSKSWHLFLTHFAGTSGQNTLLLTWEILLWGYKGHNCRFLMLEYSFNDLTLHIIKNNFKSVMIAVLDFYCCCINSCL